MANFKKIISLAAVYFLTANALFAQSSPNFTASKEGFISGGGSANSASFKIYPSALGEPFGSTTLSDNYRVTAGSASSPVREPGSKFIEVSGNINESSASVTVNGITAEVSNGAFLAKDVLINEGPNIITVNAADLAGNSQEKNITVYYDPTPPACPTLNSITSPTADPVIRLSGVKEKESSILILDKEVIPLNPSSAWSYDFTLSEGLNTIWVSSKDAAGNESTKVFATIHLDAVAPIITVEWPQDGLATAGSFVCVTGFVDDFAEVKINGNAVPLNGIDFTTAVPLNLGSNIIKVEAESVTGKISAKEITVLRGVAPVINNITPADKSRFYETDSVNINVETFAGATEYQFSIDGAIKKAWSAENAFTWDIPPGTFGRKKIKIQARNPSGGEDTRQIEYFIYLKPAS